MHCSAFIVTSILFKNDPGWSWALVGQRGGVPRPFPLALLEPTPVSRVSPSPPLVGQLHTLHLPPRDPRRAPQRRFGWDSRPSRPHTPRPLLTWLVGLVSRCPRCPIPTNTTMRMSHKELCGGMDWCYPNFDPKMFFFSRLISELNEINERGLSEGWRMSKGCFWFLR